MATTKSVLADGTIQYRNADGELHSEDDNPAEITKSGTRIWYTNGKTNRGNGLPAFVTTYGTQVWYKDDMLHRSGGLPAVVHSDGSQEFWYNGKPVVVKTSGTEVAYINIPEVLYHATYRHLLDSILTNGLGHPDFKPQKMWCDSDPRMVYLAENVDAALSYAETSEEAADDWLDNVIVIAISTARIDAHKLGLDPNIQNNTGDSFVYSGVIPNHAFIRVMNDSKEVILPENSPKLRLRY